MIELSVTGLSGFRRRVSMARLEQRAAAVADRVPPVALLVAPAVVVLAIAAMTPAETRMGMAIDIDIFHAYADRLVAGEALYRDVHVEYPPLAVIPMLLPLLGVGTLGQLEYLWRFALEGAVLSIAAGWLIWRLSAGSRPALGLWLIAAGLSWVAIAFRYDIWPAVCVLVALSLARGRHPGAAGIVLGLGTMFKLYPAALVPILGLALLAGRDPRGAVRLGFGWAMVVAVVMAVAWLIAGDASIGWLRYQQDRGLQIESVGASILLGLHLLVGLPVEAAFSFGAIELRAPGADALVAVEPVELAVIVGAILVMVARGFRSNGAHEAGIRLGQLALGGVATVGGILLASKVLSFQYALWLMPFLPFLPSRLRWLGVGIAAASTWIFTFDYIALWHFSAVMIAGLLARNVLLAAFVVVAVVTLQRRPAPAIATGGDPAGRLAA